MDRRNSTPPGSIVREVHPHRGFGCTKEHQPFRTLFQNVFWRFLTRPTWTPFVGLRPLLVQKLLYHIRSAWDFAAYHGTPWRHVHQPVKKMHNYSRETLSTSDPEPENAALFSCSKRCWWAVWSWRDTYLFRVKRKNSFAIATSVVTAQLLRKGKTALLTFWIPIPYNKDSMCHIDVSSREASKLDQVDLIIWDEAVMCMRHNSEAVERISKDLMRSNMASIKLFYCSEILDKIFL